MDTSVGQHCFSHEKSLIRNMHPNEHVTACASCGEQLHGKYCSHCGEKKLNEHDKTVSHFFGEFFHMLTHADSKFIKSLKYVFTRPGQLTIEFLNGRRKKYASPLTIFIIANLLYFLLPTGISVDTFNSNYQSQRYGQPYSEQISGTFSAKMQKKQWNEKEMEEHYNTKTRSTSKLMLIVFVFLFSIPVCLLFFNNRGYYFDHLVFATEFVSFVVIFFLILLPAVLGTLYLLITRIFHLPISVDINGAPVTTFTALLLWTYLSILARRVYSHSPWVFLKTLLLTACFIPLMFFYRYILFYVTIWLL